MKTLAILLCAFGIICVCWAIHPGVGFVVAMLAYGAVDGLLSK
jgi:hypothetical protein